MRIAKFRILRMLLLTMLICAFGCEKKSDEPKPNEHPVKIITMAKSSPGRSFRLTGSARSWREESLSFEINGRVENVLDEDSVVGLQAMENKDGTITTQGQVVARLDSSRYDAEVASAQARLESAKAEARAIEKEIDELIPQDINRASARVESLEISLRDILPHEREKSKIELERAERELRRAKRLYEQSSESERAYDIARARWEIAKASHKKVEANIPFQEKELQAAKANLAKAKASIDIRQAQLQAAGARGRMAEAQLSIAYRNQEDCELRAPFSGIILTRKVSRGAVVGPRQPVVVITTIDPIIVEVAVSAKVSRSILSGDPVKVYPTSLSGEQVEGWVLNKSVAADARTRTYNIICMVRNRMIYPRGGNLQKDFCVTREDAALVWRSNIGNPSSPLMVWTKAISKDKRGHYAWIITDFKLGKQKIDFLQVKVKKIYFRLGSEVRSFARREFYEIRDQKNLEPGMLALQKEFPGLKQGLVVSYVPTDWMIHSGDLIPVSFDLGEYPQGIYIPIESIVTDGDNYNIFIHERGYAKKVSVSIFDIFRETRRVQAEIPLEGKELIVFGAQYVKDGDKVAVSQWEGR